MRLVIPLLILCSARAFAAIPAVAEAEQALVRAAHFFRSKVAVQGTYLWQYSEDLSKREGEGKAAPMQGWVQPPGTPAVGLAMLSAWKATGRAEFLEAAREAAAGLLKGQLRSGGWAHSIELAPELRGKHAYRVGGGEKGRNVTTFDDDSTQASVRFLAELDQALRFGDAVIHEALVFALEAICQAQYPNGAWPQGYETFPAANKFPVQPARYPETWPREWPGAQQYWLKYTLNDNNLERLVETLFLAERVCRAGGFEELAARCRAAAEKAGDFLILAQMPEPQPAWAQQYDFEMHPSWARKFEPPSVSGGESQGAIETLLRLYASTGRRKYLEPVPRAVAYLQRSRLEDGRLARFYELRSNQPLYFTREYRLTHSSADVPAHYSFKVSDRTSQLEREYRRLSAATAEDLRRGNETARPKLTEKLAAEARAIIQAQDEQGRWVEMAPLRYFGPDDSTRHIIRCATFNRNVETLSRYIDAAKAKEK